MTTDIDQTKAATVAAQILTGDHDQFLKSLFDIIVGRKDALGGALPPQQRIDQGSISEAMERIVGSALADWERELLQADAAPPPALHTAPKPKAVRKVRGQQPRHYRRPALPPPMPNRPDIGMAAQPANSIQPYVNYKGAANPDDYLLLDSNLYARADVIGICVQVGSLFGLQDLRVKVVGVGPKAVKALVVNQPPVGTMHGNGTRKVDLSQAWATNTPVYFQHSILSPVLAH
jgi:hypothetical protein